MDPGHLAQVACLWEVTARKVGNVHPEREFADLHFNDFVQSAQAIAPVMSRASHQSVGRTILDSIQATRQVVPTNTNLGIVLLLAPLAALPEGEPFGKLEGILDSLSVEDSRLVFSAIRLAQPGGLGQAAQEDVRAEPTLPLRAIMALAAERDLVARQYANGFLDVLGFGLPSLQRHLLDDRNVEQAIILTHLDILARYPDSLIARKKGLDQAREVSRRAAEVARVPEPARAQALAELDAWLSAEGLNPGTSADLVTACLFIALRLGIVNVEAWPVQGLA